MRSLVPFVLVLAVTAVQLQQAYAQVKASELSSIDYEAMIGGTLFNKTNTSVQCELLQAGFALLLQVRLLPSSTLKRRLL